MNSKEKMRPNGCAIISICVFIILIVTSIDIFKTNNHRDANEAYKRLRDQGYSTQEIYEMGKQ